MRLFEFFKDDSGAVTVDWVVLTAATMGVGIAAYMTVSGGVEDLSTDISLQTTSQRIFTDFSNVTVGSDFATTIAGWAVTGSGRAQEISHHTGLGSDGEAGFMMFTDSSAGYSWLSMPETFRGDHGAKYGGSISYDLALFSGTNFAGNPPIMKLTGSNGTVLQYSDPTRPENGAWTSYSAELTAGNWTKSNGQMASEAEIRDVLSDIQTSEMRVEYINGSEQIGVDNVQFKAP